jgi:4-amino-4-deoxy-L-arabinose transferase-like glycosyltransferase
VIALVVFRSYPFLAYEHLDFDSDQAIVGLMAKHLSEFRTFPLFFYGQHYMLGVQAWIAAPFYWIGGPTVAMLRMPLVIVNGIAIVWLMRLIARSTGSAHLALAAVLPLAASTPVLSANLIETLGASVEPFFYVLALWALRDRPVPFGIVLAVGFLHREFTIFAVGGVAVASYWERGRASIADARWAAWVVLSFGGVWLIVDQLKRHSNTLGPPGGISATAPLTLQFETLVARVSLEPSLAVQRLRQVFTDVIPDLLGMRELQPLHYNINSTAIVGSPLIAWLLLAAGAICLTRIAASLWMWRASRGRRWPSPFCIYLAAIGAQAVMVYSLSTVDPRFPAILRYALFALFLPIALVTAFFEIERRRGYRLAVALLFAFCGALSVRDSWRFAAEYRGVPPPADEHRILADDLVAHGIQYGSAIYADAYITDFFARERVILNSTEKVRIGAYEAEVGRNLASAVRVVRQPCSAGRPVASWCIVDPLGR